MIVNIVEMDIAVVAVFVDVGVVEKVEMHFAVDELDVVDPELRKVN